MTKTNQLSTYIAFFSFLIVVLFSSGCCRGDSVKRVTLYCSQDREYAEGIIADYTKATGVQVDLRCDTEANKSVSMYEALVREAGQPRCDVFWSNDQC